MMTFSLKNPEFLVSRNQEKCINCQVCARQCSQDVHSYDEIQDKMKACDENCVNCQRCVSLCPTNALTIKKIFPGI